MVVIVMGVSGSGKTTVGALLAERIGAEFLDADDFHSASNVAKMSSGVPLTDADRLPWLRTLHDAIAKKDRVVLACSALKRAYRKILSDGIEVRFVYLRTEREILIKRLNQRKGHFMNAGLIDSQFAALEEPMDAIIIDSTEAPATIVDLITSLIRRPDGVKLLIGHRP